MGTDLRTIFTPAVHSIRKPKTLIFVGRLVEKKGVIHLIDALRFVHCQHPETELLIIGDGPEENALRAHAKTVGVLPSPHFLGPLPHDELAVHYQSATLAVFPFVVAGSGDQEGFGLVIVEALGCECPVIASDLPAVHDTITDGVTGLLVPPASPALLAEKIIDLLDNPELRYSIAQSGRAAVVSRFDWQCISLRYTDLLLGLIKDLEHRLGGL
jgi:glycosyltransferase involved in cell wall biosynthesis